MKSFLSKLDIGVKSIFGYIGVAMIFIETYAVFARNFLKVTSVWTDETLKLLFIWVIFITSALAFLTDDLIALNLVEEKIASSKCKGKDKAFGTIKVIQYLLGFLVGVFLTIQSVNIVSMQFSTNEITAVMKYPLWIINSGLLIGSVLVAIFAIYKIWNCRIYFK